nr:caspase family protein [Bosea sp. WAO]
MGFRGLFIGIDRYHAPEIYELNCAKRNASALEALFSYTLGDSTFLRADHDVTRARIEAEFLLLRDTSPDDTVVVAFSGHGSERTSLSPTTPRWPSRQFGLDALVSKVSLRRYWTPTLRKVGVCPKEAATC